MVFEDKLWIVQITALIVCYFIIDFGFLYSVLCAFSIYCILGGWKFVRVLILTAPRDVKGLYYLMFLKWQLKRMIRGNIGIPNMFDNIAAKYSNKVALISGSEDVWTFGQLDAYSNQVANYFIRSGYKQGDVIALFMESRPVYIAIWLGMAKVGIVPALINFNLRMHTLIHCIKAAEARALVYGVELTEHVLAIQSSLPTTMPLYSSSRGLDASRQTTTPNGLAVEEMDQALVTEASSPRPQPARPLKPSDPLIFVYTSGTTGMPKAAVVTHSRYFIMGYGVNALYGTQPNDVFYVTLPLYHTAGGILGVGACLMRGSTLVIRPKFSASRFWEECIQYNCTVAQYIGELCRYLLLQPPRPSDRQHKVKLVFGNGIRPHVWKEFQERFGVERVGEFYGATESNCNIVNFECKLGAVGFTTRILPFMYPITLIRMLPNSEEPMRDSRGMCVICRPGEPGQLVGKIVKGDLMRQFDGYVNQSANSKKVVSNVFKMGDLAFLSGDILEMDDLGYFYFRDRVGDTFRWRGENVSTAEVEQVLGTLLGHADIAVYGVEIPGAEGRAGMAAVVVPSSATAAQIDGILDVMQTQVPLHLPAYARPLFLRLAMDIELTSTFKMKKLDLVRVGYNPALTQDRIYLLDAKTGTYQPLENNKYLEIANGKSRF